MRGRRVAARRAVLALLLVCVGVVVVGDFSDDIPGLEHQALAPAQAQAPLNPIQIENSQPGTPGWDDFASVAQQDAVSGYASKISVNRGEAVDFFVTTTAATYTIEIFRTGWYQGIGARRLASLGSFPGVRQPIPPPDPVTGMVAATSWSKATTFTVPATWVTGVYLAKLSASSGRKSFIFFVVRNDGDAAPIVMQTSVTTYQAYNGWGGVSLYSNTTNRSVYRYDAATKVSFDRPFDPLDGNGSGQYLFWEYPFVRWAESQGYDVTYTTNIDTHTNVNPLSNHRVFVSVGHDEYWTRGMRDNVADAIAQGVNAAFFSANTAYWQIRLEPNAAGVPNRVEVGYKESSTFDAPPGPDPQYGVNNAVVTTRWRDAPVNQPENGLLGVMYEDQVNQSYPYVVQNAGHWIYAGTGFVNGSSVPGIVGYEYDKVWNNGFSPPGLTTLSSSPVVGCCEGSGSSRSNSTMYTAPSGARVFASGTIQWAWGLDNYSASYAHAGIQRTTANILDEFSRGSASPAPAVSLTPSTLAFGNRRVGMSGSPLSATLRNVGTAPLTVGAVGISGAHAGDFAQTNTCPASLAAGASCEIAVSFVPTAVGGRGATLTVDDNAAGSPHSVSLSGTGTAPAVSLTPSALAFSAQPVGTTSAPASTTVGNTGTAPLSLSGITVTGTDPSDFDLSTNCPLAPATLAANSTCVITVTFTPTVLGDRAATVRLTDDAADSPQTVALSGRGTEPAPVVSLAPGSIAFPAQRVGATSAPETVALTNTGSAPLTISMIAVAGTGAGDFPYDSTCPIAPATLAAGGTCTIATSFRPSASGPRSASLVLTDDAVDSPQSVPLSGTGTEPAVQLTPASLSFPTQPVGTMSAAQAITLRNVGTAPLALSSIGVAGSDTGDFSQSNTCPSAPSTLAVNATCTISVRFAPSALGGRSATLSIADDAPGSPHVVALAGTGTDQRIAFDKSLGTKGENVANNKMTLTTTAAAVPGARVFIFASWHHGSRTLTSVSGGGLTWTVNVQAKNSTNYRAAIASAHAAPGLAVGTVITLTFSGSVTHGLVSGASFTGLAASSVVDAVSSSSQAGVAAWSRTVTTTNANDLVLGWSSIDRNTTSTPAAPNIEIHDFGNAVFGQWGTAVYRIESTAGPKTVNGTWLNVSGATANVTVVAAYKSS